MADKAHQDNHKQMMRFGARQAISSVGCNCGVDCATAAARGMLLGALDELKTLIGQREAFEYLMSVGDSMLKPIEVAPVTITIVVDGSTPPDADLAAKISAAFNFPK